MSKKSKYRDIVLDYLTRMPEIPHRTLTKKICTDFNCHEDFDKICCAIRYHTGSQGEGHRKTLKDKTHQEAYYQRLSLPKPKTYKDYKPIEFKAKKVLFICDTHFPDHDIKAIKLALNFAKKEKVDTIIMGGDIIDGYQISKFDHDTTTPSFKEEIEMAEEWFSYLRQEFPDEQIIYKAGNHDLPRLTKYINNNAKALANLEALKLENLLKLKEYNIKYVEDMPLIKIGKLLFAHGHEFPGCPSADVARRTFAKAHENIIFGHFHHRDSYDDVNVIFRTTKSAYAVGCLCNLQPDYRVYSKFQHGFAIVNFDKNGWFHVENKLIINNKIT